MAKKRGASQTESAQTRPTGTSGSWAFPADEAPFLREIFANRFDDAPRLIFADWLEERGDPRAEFIRVQCQLAKLRVRDPQYASLEARATALAHKHQAKWLKLYPELKELRRIGWGIDGATSWNFAGRGSRHYFRRGLLAAIHPRSMWAFLRRAELFVDGLGMSELDAPLKTVQDAHQLAKLPQLARIDALLLPGGMPLASILTSPNLGPLWRLDGSELQSGSAGLGDFLDGPKSQRLRWLRLGSDGQDQSLEALLLRTNAPQLDTLVLASSAQGHPLFALAADTRLRLSQLRFSAAGMTPSRLLGCLQRLSAASALREAVTLRIEDWPDGAQDVLEQFPLPPRVTRLLIQGRIRDAEVTVIARSKGLAQLTDLTIEGDVVSSFGDVAAQALAHSSVLTNLRGLDLADSILREAGAWGLILSESLVNLERLNLQRTFIRSKVVKAQLRKAFRGKLEV